MAYCPLKDILAILASLCRNVNRGELPHNYCYRKWYRCLKNIVTQRQGVKVFHHGDVNDLKKYGSYAVEALKVAWEATDRICSRRLQPFLSELVRVLSQHGEKVMTAEVEAQLCQMSSSTIDRLIRPYRRLGGRRPFTTTKPGSLLKNSIPIRTFADWEENRPGFFEVDLVPIG
jgi:hypothetical protein